MFRKWTLSLILLFVWAAQSCVTNDTERLAERLHVCTVANKRHPNLQKLIHSCNAHGIKLDIIGMNKVYRRNTDKLRYMKRYCKRLPKNDLVLFVDAFDVLILADKKEIVSRFLDLNVPMLMAMETNCWPIESASFYPSTSSPFKYINSGCYMGWVKDVKKWLNAFDKILLAEKSDQAAVHKVFERNPSFHALDHWNKIFLCLYQVPSDVLQIDKVNKQIHCSYTNSSPCILHANGKSFDFWDQVYSSFFDTKATELQEQIQKLATIDPHQLSVQEYTYLVNQIQQSAPCNVLVFGLGNDSALWHQINPQGKTVFLEHNPEWYDKITSQHPHLTSHFIKYHTQLRDWKLLLEQNPAHLTIELPPEVIDTRWDVIFVDSPEGYAMTMPGRMQSIYMASILGKKGHSRVFVHDCDRPAENAYCSRFLGDATLVQSIKKLRHYHFKQ